MYFIFDPSYLANFYRHRLTRTNKIYSAKNHARLFGCKTSWEIFGKNINKNINYLNRKFAYPHRGVGRTGLAHSTSVGTGKRNKLSGESPAHSGHPPPSPTRVARTLSICRRRCRAAISKHVVRIFAVAAWCIVARTDHNKSG